MLSRRGSLITNGFLLEISSLPKNPRSYCKTQFHIAALTRGLGKTERSAKIIFEDSIRNIILSFYMICLSDPNELENV